MMGIAIGRFSCIFTGLQILNFSYMEPVEHTSGCLQFLLNTSRPFVRSGPVSKGWFRAMALDLAEQWNTTRFFLITHYPFPQVTVPSLMTCHKFDIVIHVFVHVFFLLGASVAPKLVFWVCLEGKWHFQVH